MRATRRPSHAHRLLPIVLGASIGLTGSVSAAPGDAVKGPFTVGGLSGSGTFGSDERESSATVEATLATAP